MPMPYPRTTLESSWPPLSCVVVEYTPSAVCRSKRISDHAQYILTFRCTHNSPFILTVRDIGRFQLINDFVDRALIVSYFSHRILLWRGK